MAFDPGSQSILIGVFYFFVLCFVLTHLWIRAFDFSLPNPSTKLKQLIRGFERSLPLISFAMLSAFVFSVSYILLLVLGLLFFIIILIEVFLTEKQFDEFKWISKDTINCAFAILLVTHLLVFA